jgi:hypothetical protein
MGRQSAKGEVSGIVTRSIEFHYDFPEDWEFDEHENPIAPGNRGLAEAITLALGRRVTSTTPIELHEYYGWGFWSFFDGCSLYNVLNPIVEGCYLTVSFDSYWLRALMFKRPRTTFDDYCAILGEVLGGLPGVSRPVWQGYRN